MFKVFCFVFFAKDGNCALFTDENLDIFTGKRNLALPEPVFKIGRKSGGQFFQRNILMKGLCFGKFLDLIYGLSLVIYGTYFNFLQGFGACRITEHGIDKTGSD